jgi:hypothetical protein
MRQSLVESGLNTSVGFVELDWDKDADGGLGQVKVMMHDSFDILIDPQATIYSGLIKGRFVGKSIKRPVEEIKNDDRYDEKKRKDVVADDLLSESTFKARILTKEGLQQEEETKRATVKEIFLYDDEGDKKSKIRLVTYCGKQLLRDELLKKTDFPIYCFQVPQDTKKVYHRSWVADLVPLNKILDRIVSQRVMYVNQALVFRMIAEKGHGANAVTNEMGELIEINPGKKWEQQQMYPLPTTLESTEMAINRYIEDVGGAHEAALGRMPQGARSGDQIEALQAADANNLAGLRLSLESFLSVLGSAILDIIAEKYVAARVIKITDPEEQPVSPQVPTPGQPTVPGAPPQPIETEPQSENLRKNYLEVVGSQANDKVKKEGAVIVNTDNEVIVKIGSWLGYTQEAQRKTLMELAGAGILPAEEILRQYEFPNINELSEKARAQRLEQHVLDAEIAGRNQNQGQMKQPQGQQSQGRADLVALADKENMQMMQGQPLPPTEGADLQHTQAHADFMQSQTFMTGTSQQIKQIFGQHVQGELAAHNMTQ